MLSPSSPLYGSACWCKIHQWVFSPGFSSTHVSTNYTRPNHSFLHPPPYNSPTNTHTHAYISCSPSHILSVVADLVKSFHVALADLKRKALVAAKQAAKEAAKVAAKEAAKGAVKTGGKRKARE